MAFLLWAGAAAAAERIGRVEHVEVWATGTPEGGTSRPKHIGNGVEARETVATVENGALHLIFLDRTELRLGSAATVVLDSYVYDRARGGEAVLRVARGITRFISGRLGTGQLRVRTPSVEIGVRGTDFSVWVEADGRTTIWVNEGAISVQPLAGGAAADVAQGETVAVAAGATAVQRAAPRPLTDRGLLPAIELNQERARP
ncbi:FecR family protein [Desertibaculum subflavum]|uniref:FecR family protein n=1 Tax=Desertibaculum subflavum TaxID=2268458 RepID=UPI0013C3EAB9